MIKKVSEGVHAFFFVDPGGTSGVAAAHIELKGTLKKTLQEGVLMKKSVEVKGKWFDQAKEISDMAIRFLFTAQVERGIPAQNIYIGFENYTRRPGAYDNNLEPVYVTAATSAFLWVHDRELDFIMAEPSQAKTFATNERLKLWGLYEVGSEHKRDAYRHLALCVNTVLA